MNDDLAFGEEGNAVPRHNLGDDKRLPAEMSSENGRSSTIHSLLQPSEEMPVNFLDHPVPQGWAGRDSGNDLASERRVKLGPNPQFMITSNSLFSKTSGYLDDREKSIHEQKLKQSIDDLTF